MLKPSEWEAQQLEARQWWENIVGAWSADNEWHAVPQHLIDALGVNALLSIMGSAHFEARIILSCCTGDVVSIEWRELD